MEENLDVPELGRILFKKKFVEVKGERVQYTASSKETLKALRQLLQRRKAFMMSRGLEGDDYVFKPDERAAFMKEWRDEYHASPEQVALQERDAQKPSVKKVDQKGDKDHHWKSWNDWRGWQAAPGWKNWQGGQDWQGWEGASQPLGSNTNAVRHGKHSRFARHLQRVGGTKTIVELICYTGSVDPYLLAKASGGDDNAQSSASASQPSVQAGGGASQPVDGSLRKEVLRAKAAYRQARVLQANVVAGKTREQWLKAEQKELLARLRTGELLQEKNEAILAYGHGTLVADGGEQLTIGCSTGGTTRKLLDNWQAPTPERLQDFVKRSRRDESERPPAM
jgi:hypothetical protein